MSNEEQNPETQPAAPIHNPLKDPALETREVPEVLDFLRENGVSILIGVGLAVIAFLGYSAYKNYKRTQEITASSMLFNSKAAEQFQQVIDQYPNSPTAPLAHLALAGQYFDEGQFELAQHIFGQFLQKYPTHDLKPAAVMGNVQCLESLGRYDEALTGYEAFLKDYPNSYLQSVAEFGKARCLEQLGRYDEAKVVYEDFVVAHPEDRWTARAQASIQFIEKELRARARAPVQAEAPAPAVTFTPEASVAPAVTPAAEIEDPVPPPASP